MAKIIAHMTYSFNVGGLEKVIVNLINSCDPEQVSHVIITLAPGQDLVKQLKVPVKLFCLNKKPGNDVSSHIRLYSLLRKIKPHVLHTYNFGTMEYQFVARAARVPIGVHAEHGRDGEYDERTRRRRSLVRKLILPFIDSFVVVSKDLYDWAKDDLRVNQKKLQYVFNGVDVKEFECNRKDKVGNPFTFVAVGRLVEVKNHAFLLSAFSEFAKKHVKSEMRLLIVGDGPLYGALSDKVKSLQLEQKVQLTGGRDDIAFLLKAADAFVLTSKYEAMPMTALEAMASGLPVIATNVGGVPNIVIDRETGLLVESDNVQDLAETMSLVMKDGDDVRKIARKGTEMVNALFSSTAMKDSYLRLYRLS